MNDLNRIYNGKTKIYSSHINLNIIKYIKTHQIILDVGCSEGAFGVYVKKNNQAIVFGIDISNKAILVAKEKIDRAYVCNVETDSLPFKKKLFDVIVCGDVLEHLYNPGLTLVKLKNYLNDNGYIVLSVPNIAYFKIRYNLLRGMFNYENTGILDNSHIRFFTKETLEKIIKDAGFFIKNRDYYLECSPSLLKVIENISVLRKIKNVLVTNFSTLFAYQFIMVIEKI